MFNSTCPALPIMPIDPSPLFSNGNINFKAHDVGWIISLVMALIGTTASFWLIDKHLRYFYAPTQQRHIVRILFMVPIYSVTSFLSYYFYNNALYFQLGRDCYEAFVISSFFHLLLSYLSSPPATLSNPCPAPYETRIGRERKLRSVFREVKVGSWMFPFGWVKWRPAGGGKGEGESFLWLMRIGIGQYVIIRPLSTLLSVVSQAIGLYCGTSWSLHFFHPYMSVLVSISVSIAMYCVLQLYMPLKKELAPYRPVLKFLSVKSVVFLTFWQETMLGVLEMAKVIKTQQYWSAAEIVIGLSAILSCFEMMIFGFVHIKAFTYLPYRALALPIPSSPPSPPPPSPSFPTPSRAQTFSEWTKYELPQPNQKVPKEDKRLVKLKPSDYGTREPDGNPIFRRTRLSWSLVKVLNISDIFFELKNEASFVVSTKKEGERIDREEVLENVFGARGRKEEDRKSLEEEEEEDEEKDVEEEGAIDRDGRRLNPRGMIEAESLLYADESSFYVQTKKKEKKSSFWNPFRSRSRSPPPLLPNQQQTFQQIPHQDTSYSSPHFSTQLPIPSSYHYPPQRQTPTPTPTQSKLYKMKSSPDFAIVDVDIPLWSSSSSSPESNLLPPPHKIDPIPIPSSSFSFTTTESNSGYHKSKRGSQLPPGARMGESRDREREREREREEVVGGGGERERKFVFEEY